MSKKKLVALGIILLLLILVVVKFASEPTPLIEEELILTPEEIVVLPPATSTVNIGSSVAARVIDAYTFGKGETDLLFVGGVHGGYEWNSILLAYEMIDYLNSNLEIIPPNITVHIIPNLNPDGLYEATGLEGKFLATEITSNQMHTNGSGRMNANSVDLNRNFDCKWAPESSWRSKVVSAGTAAFSEPEAQALRDYVIATQPEAAIFWHSIANNVYASECNDGILPGTLSLMNVYAEAGGYGAVPVFDAYEITGDAEGWLASIGIPAITVELGSRTSIEWNQNLAGVNAVLNLYAE